MANAKSRKTVSKKKAQEILEILTATYPEAHCELNFATSFELLIATVLSAQATDKKVNQITEKLFAKYPSPERFLQLTQEQMEAEIKEIGLFRNKAKNILALSQILIDKFQGQVPNNMEDLIALPGVGRKTANVVLSNAFGIPAIAVDTHVLRVSNRLGLANANTPDQVEQQLMTIIPKASWINAHHWLIWHGRRICDARKPKCEVCPLLPHCRHHGQ